MTETNPQNAEKKPRFKFRIPFGLQLAFIVTLILLGSIWTITTLMALMVGSEFIRTAGETNFDINSRAASGVKERLYKVRSDAMLLLDMTSVAGPDSDLTKGLRNIFFERNPNIAAVIVPRAGGRQIINQSFFFNNEIPQNALNEWLAKVQPAIDRAKVGDPVLKNASPELGINLLALFYPWQGAGVAEAAVVFFSPENLAEIAGTGSSSTVVINGDGDILVHPDFSQVLAGVNISGTPLVEALRKSPGESISLTYTVAGNSFVGAGHQISLADAAVLSSREYSVITGQVVAVTRRNILLSLTVLFLTILVTWFYSRTITSRLRKLMAGIGSYEAGDFNVDIKTKSRDELGVLTERFAGMGQALNRREEINNLVGRYHDQNISSQAMAGELNLRGEYLKTVVLFVELASFQEISKYLEAPESLELLNSFISKMGECIEKNGGRLDTVISGRLIALWGVPLPSPDISADVLKSLQAAMMMRKTLWDLNTEREKQGKPNLRMGCGIHTGELLAGSMGTSAFRQYSVSGTVIGEAIKTGEAAGSFDTDILITDAVQELAGSRILSEKLTTRRRRKSDLQYFGLVNIAAQNQETQRWPFTLDDVRESLQGSRSVPAGRQGKSADKSDREPAG